MGFSAWHEAHVLVTLPLWLWRHEPHAAWPFGALVSCLSWHLPHATSLVVVCADAWQPTHPSWPLVVTSLIVCLIRRPTLDHRSTKLWLLMGLGVLPIASATSANVQGYRATQHRAFCGSCHVMIPHACDSNKLPDHASSKGDVIAERIGCSSKGCHGVAHPLTKKAP